MTRLRTSRSTIRRDPFADVIPVIEPEARETKRRQFRPAPTPPRTTAAENADRLRPPTGGALSPSSPTPANDLRRPDRQKLTVHLEPELVNRVKNAAYYNPRLTITKIAEEGIRSA